MQDQLTDRDILDHQVSILRTTGALTSPDEIATYRAQYRAPAPTPMIAFTLSDGSGCYGRETNQPGIWWLRRTIGPVSDEYNKAAPPEARQQAEQALAAHAGNFWPLGSDITINL